RLAGALPSVTYWTLVASTRGPKSENPTNTTTFLRSSRADVNSKSDKGMRQERLFGPRLAMLDFSWSFRPNRLGRQKLDLAALGHRVLELGGHGAGGANPALGIECDKCHALGVHSASHGGRVDAFDCDFARFLWVL